MKISTVCDRVREMLLPAIDAGNSHGLNSVSRILEDQYPFVFSMLNDSISRASQIFGQEIPDAQLVKFKSDISIVIQNRLNSLLLWEPNNNQTVQSIQEKKITAKTIKPHIRFSFEQYKEICSKQNEEMKMKALPTSGEEKDFNDISLGKNVNHAYRLTQAITLVEVIFGLLAKLDSNRMIRWMDIGCGTGAITNSVNPRKYGLCHWSIVGCDMQEGRILFADSHKARGRRFFASDAFDILTKAESEREQFDIVTMFEVLEHLDDPLSLLRKLNSSGPEIVIAGSPLAQDIGRPLHRNPDPVHLWSFTRKSWEQMFALAGFEIIYCSETRVGSYIGGLDWLTVVCGDKQFFRNRRDDWG